uniref:LysM peptidoglycan-binding domain-containing protein n=1 Tax=Fundidesulfovibrio putealis TaxID=270496 RepID=A0A7C4AG60_9BACT
MMKTLVTAIALSLALTGCGLLGDKPQPAPVVEVKPEPAPPPPPPPPPPLTHTVKKGETLTALGKKYGVSAAQILAANSLKDAKAVKAGMVLTIPGKTAQPLAEKTPAKPEKEVKETKDPKEPKAKGSKSDPYGIESATAPDKGKKKPGKVDDDATFEKVKADFHEYARKWLEKSAGLAQFNKDKKEVKQVDGRWVATYSVILMNTMQTEVKRVEYDHTPYVAHITYQLEVHNTYGTSAAAALASKDEEVKQESMREIFSYSGQKKAWR